MSVRCSAGIRTPAREVHTYIALQYVIVLVIYALWLQTLEVSCRPSLAAVPVEQRDTSIRAHTGELPLIRGPL